MNAVVAALGDAARTAEVYGARFARWEALELAAWQALPHRIERSKLRRRQLPAHAAAEPVVDVDHVDGLNRGVARAAQRMRGHGRRRDEQQHQGEQQGRQE
jgi:hypothetical protein